MADEQGTFEESVFNIEYVGYHFGLSELPNRRTTDQLRLFRLIYDYLHMVNLIISEKTSGSKPR
jgi:hypothetical protein